MSVRYRRKETMAARKQNTSCMESLSVEFIYEEGIGSVRGRKGERKRAGEGTGGWGEMEWRAKSQEFLAWEERDIGSGWSFS